MLHCMYTISVFAVSLRHGIKTQVYTESFFCVIPLPDLNVDNILLFCKYGSNKSFFKQNHMERKARIGVAMLFLGILIPILICVIFGPPDSANVLRNNVAVCVLFFCIGLDCKAGMYKDLLLRYGQMLIAGCMLSAVIINVAIHHKDYFIYFAAVGYATAIILTLYANASKKESEAPSTT
jgi:peptidoglycan/LPS O-acetylase OafA/YrhL